MFPDHFRRSLMGAAVFLVLAAVALVMQLTEDEEKQQRPENGATVVVEVDRVVDGDTAKVFYGGKSEYVRYIGIDTPESVKEGSPVECYGEQAKEENARLLAGSDRLKLVFDQEQRDHYGRLLAYVYSGSTLLQETLLRGGYATTIEVPPNTARAGEFSELEDEARSAGRGLWSAC